MPNSNGNEGSCCPSFLSNLCSTKIEVQELVHPPNLEFMSLPATQPETLRSESPANAPQQSLFPLTTARHLPNITVPSTGSKGSFPQRYTKTPPPRPQTHNGTTPTTPKSNSKLPSNRASWGRATQASPVPRRSGAEPGGSVSGPSAQSHRRMRSGDLGPETQRMKPPTFFESQDSLELNSSQPRESGTLSGTAMPIGEAGGPGSTSPAQSSTSVDSEGFGRYSVHDAPFIEPLTPLPSMANDFSAAGRRVDPRASTSSELLPRIEAGPSPLPTVSPRFAGPSNPRRLPSKREATRRDSDVFPVGQEPIIKP